MPGDSLIIVRSFKSVERERERERETYFNKEHHGR